MSRKYKNKKDDYDIASEIRSKQIIAEHEDLKRRFREYDDDISVGGMYARKKKTTRSKTKRKSKKKDCGCK